MYLADLNFIKWIAEAVFRDIVQVAVRVLPLVQQPFAAERVNRERVLGCGLQPEKAR